MTAFCKNCNNILEMMKTLPIAGVDTIDTAGAADATNEDLYQDVLNTKSEKGGKTQSEIIDSTTPDELSSDTEDGKSGDGKREVDAESEASAEPKPEPEVLEPVVDVKMSAEDEDFYQRILSKVEADEELTDDQIARIEIKDMIKSQYYRDLKSKSVIKKKILTMIEDMGNSDDNTEFYLFCSNCGYSRTLDSNFHVLSKNADGVASTHDYFDEDKTRLIVHSGIYPRTREFNCPNKDCSSQRGTPTTPTEACMVRDANSYHMTYVCVNCLTVKRL